MNDKFFSASFRYVTTVPESEVSLIAAFLSMPRKGAPNGSAFAIMPDAPDGKRNVYLSPVSFQTLRDRKIIQANYRELDRT